MRVTHPFHPLSGRDFEFVAYRQNLWVPKTYATRRYS